MTDFNSDERVEILSADELRRTLTRLASQVLESVRSASDFVLLGIPTRGVHLARVLAKELEALTGECIAQGSLDPTFHRDDLQRVGTRMVQPTIFVEQHLAHTKNSYTRLFCFEGTCRMSRYCQPPIGSMRGLSTNMKGVGAHEASP